MSEHAYVLITGGNSGIGFECARALAEAGEKVAIASRNLRVSEEAAREIGKEVLPLQLDLSSFAAIRDFHKEVVARDLPIKTLICNAGLQFTNGPVMTADGHESTFAVNHLGHFLLTNLLLRRLLENAPARILVVASGVHDPALSTGMPNPDIRDWDTLSTTGGSDPEHFEGRLAYSNSKLCNLWFTYELVRRLKSAKMGDVATPLSVNAFEPGLVPSTGLARDYPPAARWLWEQLGPSFGRLASRLTPMVNTVDAAGEAMARIATDPALERSSANYFPSHTHFSMAPSSEASYDEERAAELWERSVTWTGLTDEDCSLVTGEPGG